MTVRSRDQGHVQELVGEGADVNETGDDVNETGDDVNETGDDVNETGADVNKADELLCSTPLLCKTPLMRAADDGDEETLELLLAAGADVNAITTQGETALVFAVSNGHVGIAKRLVEERARVDVCDSVLGTPLIAAINHGIRAGSTPGNSYRKTIEDAVIAVQFLLEAGADVNATDELGATPLLFLIRHSRNFKSYFQPILNELVKAGADVNQADMWGQTPLRVALQVQMDLGPLLAAGADVNDRVTEHPGHIPLFLRCLGCTSIPPWITWPSSDMCPETRKPLLCDALVTRQLENVKSLLRYGCEVCVTPCSCRTLPLPDPEGLMDLAYAAGLPVVNCRLIQQDKKEPITLQKICRTWIRSHMMKVSKVNLFYRVPELGITHFMKDYLLFSQRCEVRDSRRSPLPEIIYSRTDGTPLVSIARFGSLI